MKLLKTAVKNAVLESMERILHEHKDELLLANQKDLAAFNKDDQALYDRLVVDDKKVGQMIQAVNEVRLQEDPVNKEISKKHLENGLEITNKTAPFGTIMIIYESRPDVTVEAAVLAFKANNKILLKGGKEAYYSNKALVKFWHMALDEHNLGTDYIQFLEMDRTQTQAFLKNPDQPLDLIVPRGGERLIAFVKEHAKCAVLVSGRGNNFLYVHPEADWQMTKKVIINAKTHKISACNTLDKILLDINLPDYEGKIQELASLLKEHQVSLVVDEKVSKSLPNEERIKENSIWQEEFLAMKCVIGSVANLEEAVVLINENSGGHSAAIMTSNNQVAQEFMDAVDCAAVYQNASTRFTDGGQMGVGAELAISTDKLHHRGPLGLKQLVTNKYYILGNGQIRN
ncbi:glutamate-5-semialdehyde dehydrogenase [Croceivirga radicis]|uniref:glutamate-5-semialdehyde dehydrogenase n=1 Tax=Croceivirga radicis TaxID=1929488 RepID=UPI000255ADB3|nr:glutamate-5-semialdehyde dehydrogenase [Croceivirga radicis]